LLSFYLNLFISYKIGTIAKVEIPQMFGYFFDIFISPPVLCGNFSSDLKDINKKNNFKINNKKYNFYISKPIISPLIPFRINKINLIKIFNFLYLKR
jgi:hypothetical protein